MADIMHELGTYGLWFMTAASWIFLFTLIIKTRWWRSLPGRHLFILSLWFALSLALIVFATLGLLPPEWKDVCRIFIYYGGAISFFQISGSIWWYNRKYYVWTKDKPHDNG